MCFGGLFRLSATFLVVAIHLGLSVSAQAELKFTSHDSDESPIILVEGEFEHSDKLDEFSLLVRQQRPAFVIFNSPGGNPLNAMELGRLIRKLGLATFQIRQTECASACTLAFFGGTVRMATAGALGVHKASFGDTSRMQIEDAVSFIQELTANLMLYMDEMGVDPALLQLALRYDANDMRYLSMSEMDRYRVTTLGEDDQGRLAIGSPSYTSPSPSTSSRTTLKLDIPKARSGHIRHPKGFTSIKSAAATQSVDLIKFRNGTPLVILGNIDRWYRVRIGKTVGYAHHTWVSVDQFAGGSFDERHIQIRSFRNYADAEAYIRSSSFRIVAHLAVNGWFAITLEETYRERIAAQLTKRLKAERKIPDDAFMTYGNTYVRKVCCN